MFVKREFYELELDIVLKVGLLTIIDSRVQHKCSDNHMIDSCSYLLDQHIYHKLGYKDLKTIEQHNYHIDQLNRSHSNRMNCIDTYSRYRGNKDNYSNSRAQVNLINHQMLFEQSIDYGEYNVSHRGLFCSSHNNFHNVFHGILDCKEYDDVVDSMEID